MRCLCICFRTEFLYFKHVKFVRAIDLEIIMVLNGIGNVCNSTISTTKNKELWTKLIFTTHFILGEF